MSKLRVVSYAINGRGMGHLVRQLSILRWIKRIAVVLGLKHELWVLTSSEADTLARREGICSFKMPSKAMMRDADIDPHRYLAVARGWVLNAVAGLQPDLLLVDTFPGGSFGELVNVLEMAKHRVLVARRVREEFAEQASYAELIPAYDDQITPDARDVGPIILRERSELLDRQTARQVLGIPNDKRAVYLSMGGGGEQTAAGRLPSLCEALAKRGWHVVVAAGPLYQGRECRGPNITWLDRYCPLELMNGVDAAVSAAGYNSFHELMYAGVPTVFLPLPRIADDQQERSQRAEQAGAGRIARNDAEVVGLLENPGSAEAARSLVPFNGARKAALRALAPLLPAADLQMADTLLTPDIVKHLQHASGETNHQALEVVRLLAGDSPQELAGKRALLLQLQDEGHKVPTLEPPQSNAAPRVERFFQLLHHCKAPLSTALTLLRALRRKFPAARGEDLISATEQLFHCWARFEDWMGAVSLMRAVPQQRHYPLTNFASDTVTWLASQDELFDALRALSHAEGGGRLSLKEALAQLNSAADRPQQSVVEAAPLPPIKTNVKATP